MPWWKMKHDWLDSLSFKMRWNKRGWSCVPWLQMQKRRRVWLLRQFPTWPTAASACTWNSVGRGCFRRAIPKAVFLWFLGSSVAGNAAFRLVGPLDLHAYGVVSWELEEVSQVKAMQIWNLIATPKNQGLPDLTEHHKCEFRVQLPCFPKAIHCQICWSAPHLESGSVGGNF